MGIKYHKIKDEPALSFFCDACGDRVTTLDLGGALFDEKNDKYYFYHKGIGCSKFVEKKYNNGQRMNWGDLCDFIMVLTVGFMPPQKVA